MPRDRLTLLVRRSAFAIPSPRFPFTIVEIAACETSFSHEGRPLAHILFLFLLIFFPYSLLLFQLFTEFHLTRKLNILNRNPMLVRAISGDAMASQNPMFTKTNAEA